MTTYFPLQKRPKPKLLSLVIPVFNEEESISFLAARLEELRKNIGVPLEFCFVNDGSSDRTVDFLLKWAEEKDYVKVLSLSRNFGHQVAVTAGLDYAKGDAVVIIDADLQDPPELIPQMIERYCEGYDVVYGQRISREGETLFKRMTAFLFYRFMRVLIHKDLPVDTGDFRLVSRNCLETLRSMKETHRFLRGMVTWVGFPQIGIKFERKARVAGTTKYPFKKMLLLAWNAAVSFSPLPLRIILAFGAFIATLGVIVMVYALVRYLLVVFDVSGHLTYSPGWTTLVSLLCILGGAILVGIGVLGEYVARIYEESKGRPLYIVAASKNLT